jgi:exonuclease VII large subunit
MRNAWTTFLLLIALGISSHVAADDRTISDSEAKNHVGQTLGVKGTVANVFVSPKGNVFLNFGASYPAQTFSAVIFSSDAAAFPNPQQWQGQRMIAHGKVTLYKGKPEIILKKALQLSLAP